MTNVTRKNKKQFIWKLGFLGVLQIMGKTIPLRRCNLIFQVSDQMKTTSSSDGMKRSGQTSDLLKVTRLTELPFVFVFYLSKECDLRQLRLMLFNKLPPITRLVNLVLFLPAISISSPFSSSSSSCPFYFFLSLFEGGSVAEWLGRRTWNPEVPGSSPTLTTSWICNTVASSSNPWPRYVNSQLVSLRPVGILNKFTFNLWYLVSAFSSLPN